MAKEPLVKKYAVIVAGGSGLRMGNTIPKQFLEILGKPLLYYTVNAFLNAFEDLLIVLVIHPDYILKGRQIADLSSSPVRITVIPGGETRFHSVRAGLQHTEEDAIIFVHDGVRCLVSKALIHRCYHAALEKGNAVPAVDAVDTVRIQHKDESKMVDRQSVRLIQTPQTFKGDILKNAFSNEYNGSFTDEAGVVESTGVMINLIEGDAANIKVTHPMDLVIAGMILQQRNKV